ncbi:HlyD family secretion protein [Aurantimonas sp. 22II-16-19i]|uniref:HlyD family secretion protein n=1 Tax=Aurantimonas sp. 22II-16-19i TaxID=1317114 RepID=UPI0009F7D896|nr:HlyD family secretion protein [Aurantimonas sp. 22II-16-19i]ORE90365.1 secretion protein HlyD family protein [Aurantimonas sp. 22II-16-19i]
MLLRPAARPANTTRREDAVTGQGQAETATMLGESGRASILPPILHALVAVTIVAGGWLIASRWDAWTGRARFQTTADAYVAGDVTPLAAQVAGTIRRTAVNDNQWVEPGDLIVEIDPADYLAKAAAARGDLALAEANLAAIGDRRAVQQTMIREAEARMSGDRANSEEAAAEAARQRTLLKGRLVGTQQLVQAADAAAASAAAAVDFDEANLDQQKIQLQQLDIVEKQLVSQRDVAASELRQAEIDLGYTRIVSPVSGMVGTRQVRPGQFVAVGSQVITVVSLPKVWIVANLKETQMTNVRPGDPATITIDAFPALRLTGRVDSWAPGTGSVFALLAPDNATGNFTKVVQRVPVKIDIDDHPSLGRLVRPGMSAEVTIDTGGQVAAAPGSEAAAGAKP